MTPIHYIVMFQAFNQATFTGARFLVAVYAVHLAASPFVVGLMVALFSLAPTFLTIPSGKLIDRAGTRALLQVCHVLMCVTLLVPFFWPRMELLYAVASVIGAGFFAVYVGASTFASHHSAPGERAENFSRMSVGVATGQGLSPLILGFSADYLGYAATFAVAALFPLLCWATFAFGRLEHLGPQKKAVEPQAKQSTLDLLRDPKMRPVFFISTLFILSWDIFLVMTPIYGAQLGLSASHIGLLMGAFAVASFVVRFFGGWLSRRYTPWQLLLGALVVQAAGTIVFGLVASMPLLMVSSFVVGLGYGLCGPMSNTAIYEVAPPARASEAMGLRLSLGMAAQTVFPLIVGSVGSLLAAGPIYGASGIMLLAGAAMERRHWRRENPKEG